MLLVNAHTDRVIIMDGKTTGQIRPRRSPIPAASSGPSMARPAVRANTVLISVLEIP